MQASPPPAVRHTHLEDAQALVVATLMLSLGLALYAHAGLLTGGTAGIAFLLHYWSGLGFGPVFFLVNLPFYWLALRRMGRAFTVKTFAAVALLSVFAELQPLVLGIERLEPLYAAVIGGLLMGTSLLILFRHKASLGGVGIVAFYLQERWGWRAGKVQMAVDGVIVLAAFSTVEPQRVLLSVLGAVALNLVLAINHRPGRYLGM
ncbi:YitT family protein [Caldimonas tepidiphila]|uniref:YitT family protein n=1 Tax=Caldimonas tepidiphila TaxID=2315841 RepID=UPI000E5A3CB7|nr:YitT family protein [Caldimonas tepidiphila]